MLSRKRTTIFVHIPKTAGQSIELAFLHDAGLSWKGRAALLLRRNTDPGAGPARLAHLLAREYEALGHTGGRAFAQFFSFAVVRDPVDRAVSGFNFRAPPECTTLRDYVHRAAQADVTSPDWRQVCPQTRYTHDAEGRHPLVRQVLRFETLSRDWPALSARIFGSPRPLPRSNVARRTRLTRADLGPEDLAFLAAHYAEDFRNFGYPVCAPGAGAPTSRSR